jgi:mannose-1-phosphate guanylyltransferase
MCGGIGTRLRPLSYYIQKAMIPIGRREKPLLEYAIRLLAHYHIKEIFLLADYKQEQIVNYFGDGSRFNVNITYLKDDPNTKGSLGALHNAYKKGLLKRGENFLVYYGDILSNINLGELMHVHIEKQASATLALSPNYPVPVGVAEVVKERVAEFLEKPDLGKPVSIGMLALNGNVLDEKINTGKKDLDIMGDLVPYLIHKREPVYPYLTEAFWYDVGSLEKYEKLADGILEEKLGFLFS